MKRLVFIALIFFSIELFCQSGTMVPIDKVEIGMSQNETLKIIGTPTEKIKLGEGPSGIIEVWHYSQDDKIRHSVEFTDGKVEKVIGDYNAYQNELKNMIKNTE